MNITEVKIRYISRDPESRMRAVASITLDDEIAVHDIKVIQGKSKLFIAMPSRKEENGIFRDIAHPITQDARNTLEQAILTSYQDYLEETTCKRTENTKQPSAKCAEGEEQQRSTNQSHRAWIAQRFYSGERS